MKRLVWILSSAAVLAATLWAAIETETASRNPAALLPEGALLFIESSDFHALLNNWNDSAEKRAWLAGDNYQVFSRSRLFDRLSQAQDEFSTAAAIPANSDLLASVAGQRSALALYDIGNLEFVYVTQMDEAQAQRTALWQMRDKFEQRTEGATQFYVRQDLQSNRVAAFAARDGWLVLGTRADLVAGVLDHIQGASSRSVTDEPWYSDAVKQASAPTADLRMVLNLEKIVPSPYFRSYWVQRNVTEMKQFRAALCDLHRSAKEYREDRLLLRTPGTTAGATGDVQPLLALAPESATFASATAQPEAEHALAELRENLLDLEPAHAGGISLAPSAAAVDNSGSASDLEVRVDVAPAIVVQGDKYQPLRDLLRQAQLSGILDVYATHSDEDQMFVEVDRAVVLQSASAWDAAVMENAITAALRPGLTASQLGLNWVERPGDAGSILALDGTVPMYLAARGNLLAIANSKALLQQILQRMGKEAGHESSTTYAAVFRHSPGEQQTFRKLFSRLDAVSPAAPANTGDSEQGDGQSPKFFSGNLESLSRMFAAVQSESVEERDLGEKVAQVVTYEWNRK